MVMTALDGLPYLTADEPGIGGRLKLRPEDFIVEELPLFEPADRGDHLYLYVEKRRRLTTDIVRFFTRHFAVPREAVGYAGLKDKHAVTRQWVSVEHASEDRARRFEDEHIRILDIRRGGKKLQRGNLAGNRFHIRVRDTDPAEAVRARRILDRLVRCGAPNFVGEQRFGYRRDNHLQGKHLLTGDLRAFLDQLLGRPVEHESAVNQAARRAYEAGDYHRALDLLPTVHRFERQALGPLSRGASIEDAVNGIDRSHRMLMVSAFQSAVFNRLLDDRLRAGLLDKLQPGDIAVRHDSRGVFEVRDLETEQRRCDRLEISPTGPMWGRRMLRAGGEVGRRELDALLETGVTLEDLASGDYTAEGGRRPMRMPIHHPDVRGGADEHGPYIYIGFELPRGCFATVVMRELMKNET